MAIFLFITTHYFIFLIRANQIIKWIALNFFEIFFYLIYFICFNNEAIEINEISWMTLVVSFNEARIGKGWVLTHTLWMFKIWWDELNKAPFIKKGEIEVYILEKI